MPCFKKERAFFQDPFKTFTPNGSEAHGRYLETPSRLHLYIYIRQIMAKRQSVGTFAVVMELANSVVKGSTKKSASQRTILNEWHQDQLILRQESSLFTTRVENYGIGMTTVRTEGKRPSVIQFERME